MGSYAKGWRGDQRSVGGGWYSNLSFYLYWPEILHIIHRYTYICINSVPEGEKKREHSIERTKILYVEFHFIHDGIRLATTDSFLELSNYIWASPLSFEAM